MVSRRTVLGGLLATACSAAVVGCGTSAAQEPPRDRPPATAEPPLTAADAQARDAVAAEALAFLAPDMGSDPPRPPVELTHATLGEPLRVRSTGVDPVRAYQPGTDPRPVITTYGIEFCYPVLAAGQGHARVHVRHKDEGWTFSMAGRDGPELHAIQRRLAATAGMGTIELVTTQAIGYDFLSSEKDGKLFLTPIRDVPDTPLVSGRTLPAAEAFAALKPLAERKLR